MIGKIETPSKGSVLIAGVGSVQGLGAAIARRFGREGHPIVIAGRSAEKLLATRDALQAANITVEAVLGDVSKPHDVQGFVKAARSLGALVVAVHNAGSNRPTPFLEMPEEDFEIHWREHALGGYNLARAALPALLEHVNTGSPIDENRSLFFTGASGSLRGKANFAAFSAAKGALRNLSQSLAREFGPQGVHVAHVVIDGGIEGERLLSKLTTLKEARGPDGLLGIDAIADAYWFLHHQHRSAWSQELDLRPWSENY
ncbi:SDR family NAD(P)-dependent oxidoreductase [Mesorhizobium sp. CAU 1732]|uniref:SDR family NAD(P)-dependent oxidoreductase n=1 Tax=Mesorhizobium sp. CAU 1732 TaxID=3140358 RepID=UPI0032617765